MAYRGFEAAGGLDHPQTKPPGQIGRGRVSSGPSSARPQARSARATPAYPGMNKKSYLGFAKEHILKQEVAMKSKNALFLDLTTFERAEQRSATGGNMTEGWTGSLDGLEDYLAKRA